MEYSAGQQEDEEENNSQTVVVFDREEEEDQQSESQTEYAQLVREDSPERQVAIGMEEGGKDKLPTLNVPA